jgi:hypothetical protein
MWCLDGNGVRAVCGKSRNGSPSCRFRAASIVDEMGGVSVDIGQMTVARLETAK